MSSEYTLTNLGDEELICALHWVVREDKEVTARLVAHMAEVNERGLYLQFAKSSMFVYSVEELGMSESEAYFRIYAARTARRYPLIFAMIASGELHLTAIKLVAPHLSDENHRELLQAVSHKTKRQIEHLLAGRFPRPDVEQSIRKLPGRRGQAAAPAPLTLSLGERDEPKGPSTGGTEETATSAALETLPDALATAPRAAASVEPLSSKRYKILFTASSEFHDKLRTAQALLRHEVADGDMSKVMERALDALIAQKMKKKFAKSERKATKIGGRARARRKGSKASRHIPAKVKRAALARDGMQCAFVDARGQRCQERGGLEFHHAGVPHGRGGESTEANIRLFCKAHNQHAARQDYGRDVIDAHRQRARRRRAPPRPAKATRETPPTSSGTCSSG